MLLLMTRRVFFLSDFHFSFALLYLRKQYNVNKQYFKEQTKAFIGSTLYFFILIFNCEDQVKKSFQDVHNTCQ
jgi:hypothetical protein